MKSESQLKMLRDKWLNAEQREKTAALVLENARGQYDTAVRARRDIEKDFAHAATPHFVNAGHSYILPLDGVYYEVVRQQDGSGYVKEIKS